MKKHILSSTAALFLCTLAVLWAGLDFPPLDLLARNGIHSLSTRTGRVALLTNRSYKEYTSGYVHTGRHVDCRFGDLPGRLLSSLGCSMGKPPVHSNTYCPTSWGFINSTFWAGLRTTPRGFAPTPPDAGEDIRTRPMTDLEWWACSEDADFDPGTPIPGYELVRWVRPAHILAARSYALSLKSPDDPRLTRHIRQK